jgi:arabinose operon protein AraL
MEVKSTSLSHIEGFIFDLDGTIYLGDEALPGAVETILKLRAMDRKILFVTNKPLEPRQNYAHKLTVLGIPTPPEHIITSGFVLGYHLSKTEPDLNYYVIGEDNLKNELRQHGLKIIDELLDQDEKTVIQPHNIQAVIVAFDRTLSYRKINTAYQALKQGVRFFATNPDKTCPMPGGGIPDAGATLAALELLTGRKPEMIAGKPSQWMMQSAMDIMNLPAERCMMTGDRLETDVRMGKEAGMLTAVVLTGTSTREQALSAHPAPDLIFPNLENFFTLLKDG